MVVERFHFGAGLYYVGGSTKQALSTEIQEAGD